LALVIGLIFGVKERMGHSMWTTFGLLAALSLAPAQTDELGITNIRATYGLLGPARPDNKILPGDLFCVQYDIENIKVDDTGEIQYSMALEVVDSKMKPQFKQEPAMLKGMNSLGGRRVPAIATVVVGLDQPPGMYTLKVTVSDRATKKTKAFTKEFEVSPVQFALVRLQLSIDPQGQMHVPPYGVAGQLLWVNFHAVGFKRGTKDEPRISVEMRVYDEKDQPTVAKPITGEVKELPKQDLDVPMTFVLALNRTGKYTVKLKATDQLSKKTTELSFPISVVELK
jgi:hypothetical protein